MSHSSKVSSNLDTAKGLAIVTLCCGSSLALRALLGRRRAHHERSGRDHDHLRAIVLALLDCAFPERILRLERLLGCCGQHIGPNLRCHERAHDGVLAPLLLDVRLIDPADEAAIDADQQRQTSDPIAAGPASRRSSRADALRNEFPVELRQIVGALGEPALRLCERQRPSAARRISTRPASPARRGARLPARCARPGIPARRRSIRAACPSAGRSPHAQPPHRSRPPRVATVTRSRLG